MSSGVVLWAAAGASPALAVPVAAAGSQVSATLNASGNGSLVANSSVEPARRGPGPGSSATQAQAKPAGRSAPGRSIESGVPARRSHVQSDIEHGACRRSARCGTGRCTSPSAPSVTGTVRANELVTPVHGVWAGGWTGGLSNETQLSACPTEAECRLHHAHEDGCTATSLPRAAAPAIDPGLRRAGTCASRRSSTGRTPLSLSRRSGTRRCSGPGPYGDWAWEAGADDGRRESSRGSRTASGPRTGTTCGRRRSFPGCPPQVAIKVRSAAARTQDGTATVQCLGVCTVGTPRLGARKRTQR